MGICIHAYAFVCEGAESVTYQGHILGSNLCLGAVSLRVNHHVAIIRHMLVFVEEVYLYMIAGNPVRRA